MFIERASDNRCKGDDSDYDKLLIFCKPGEEGVMLGSFVIILKIKLGLLFLRKRTVTPSPSPALPVQLGINHGIT